MSAPRGSREELATLEEEEQAVSRRRRRLHDQIDFLRGTGSGEPDVAERLAKLVAEERVMSDRRRELHALIDALRVELGVGTPGPAPKDSIRGW